MQDHTADLQVSATESAADLFRQGIADRVGVAETLALDDFDLLVAGRGVPEMEAQLQLLS